MENNNQAIKQIITNWQRQVNQTLTIVEKLSDEQLAKEIAPNRNSGSYIIGHLIAASEDVLKLLQLGDKLHPDYVQTFIATPFNVVQELPEATTLKKQLNEVLTNLTSKFEALTIEDWFSKHSNVSEEDFEKDKQRNKLNILLTRISHLAYHTGQLTLLTEK